MYMKNSCSVVDVPVWIRQKRGEYTSCQQWRNAVLDRVASIKGLDAVLVGRWKDYQTLAMEPDGSRTTSSTVGPLWQEGAERSFERLSDATKRILVIRDVPRPNGDVPACLSEHEGDAAACDFPRKGHTYLDDALVRAEKAAAPDTVRVLDLTDTFCPGNTCPVTDDGTVIYRDSHHLTSAYSRVLAEPLRRAIEAALPTAKS
jgi:hypothetical protein